MIDLPEQIAFPVDFPEDLTPERVWINYFPYGDEIIGLRPRTTIAMKFSDAQGEWLGTIQVMFFPGYTMSDEDWEIVKKDAEKAGVSLEDW